MANIPAPDVTVEQIFVTANPTLSAPTLPSVLIGQCRQIEYRQTSGEYDPDFSVVVNYPGLKEGAAVSLSSVAVHLSNEFGVFEIDSASYTATVDDITIIDGVVIDVRVIENSQTGKTTGIFFEDSSINFNKAFKALNNSASIIISAPSENQKTYDVAAIINGTKVLIVDREDGAVRAVGLFANTMTSISTTLVETDAAVAGGTSGYIIGSATGFTTGYSSTATTIANETTINANSALINSGDYLAVFNSISAEQFIIQIAGANASGLRLTAPLGTAILATDKYKIFRPVKVKGVSTAGDYVIANLATLSGSENYYAEINSITSINTISMAAALKNIAGSVSGSGWGVSDYFKIVRGASKNTNTNTYDAYISLSDYTADILVTYKADRNDLNDDVEAITGIDDIEAILGPMVPDNPLGYAALIHTQVSNSLFYAIGVSADTTVAHAKALEVLEAKEVYSLVPLSQDLDVLALYKPHVENMSQPEEKMERTAIINRDIFIADDVIVGTTAKMIGGTNSVGSFVLGMVNSGNISSTTASGYTLTQAGIDFGASVGDYFVYFYGTDQAAAVSYSLVTSVSTGLLAFSPSLALTISYAYQVVSNTYESSHATIADNTEDLGKVAVGDVINSLDVNGLVSETAVVTAVQTVSTGLGYNYQKAVVDSADLGTGTKSQIFSATTAPLNKQEQAQYIRDYAASIASRRIVHVWAPRVKLSYSPVEDPTTETSAILPGYYLCAAVAGMTASNDPSQPFSNLPISVNAQLYYTNTYFKPTYLETIAGGGNYILVQVTPDSLPYAFRQLTTDTSSIEKREYSIPKALDWFAKYMRSNLRPYTGKYNITPNYLAQLKGIAQATITDTVAIKKYLKSVNILRLIQDPGSPDEIFLDCEAQVLYPANKIKVRIYI